MAPKLIARAVIFICVGALIVLVYQHGAKQQQLNWEIKLPNAAMAKERKARTTDQELSNATIAIEKKAIKPDHGLSNAAMAKEKKATKTVQKLKVSRKIANIPVEIQDEMLSLNEQKVSHDNPRLVTLIRDYFIHPPSKEPYNLNEPNRTDYASQGKDNILPNTLKDIPDKGFFVECGGYDGETYSHSLYYEKTKHWSGLLVEANLIDFNRLLQKHRKAYSINACLSSNPYPSVMRFNQLGAFGRLVEETSKEGYNKSSPGQSEVQLQCFPLYSVLLAVNQVHVDFFGLDIEGMELPILRTIPWDKVNITYILAEVTHGEGDHPKGIYKTYFEQNGYKFIKTIGEDILVQRN